MQLSEEKMARVAMDTVASAPVTHNNVCLVYTLKPSCLWDCNNSAVLEF